MVEHGVAHLYEFSRWLTSYGCTAVTVNAMPETTGVATFVMEARSPAPVVLHSTSYIRRPRFTVHTRSTGPGPGQADYPDITAARQAAWLAYNACLSLAGETLLPSSSSTSGGNWLFAIPECEPYLDGRDNRNRAVFSFDVGCERQDALVAAT